MAVSVYSLRNSTSQAQLERNYYPIKDCPDINKKRIENKVSLSFWQSDKQEKAPIINNFSSAGSTPKGVGEILFVQRVTNIQSLWDCCILFE